MLQTTKKRACPAVIIIREFDVFPQYGIREEDLKLLSGFAQRNMRATKLRQLSEAIKNEKHVEVKRMYHISLPTNDVHIGHKCGEESGMAQRIHPMLTQKIASLVREGATNPQEIRRALREYVRSELKENCPSYTNRSYFPTLEDIRNHIYTARLGLDFSKFDQDNLNCKIQKWKEQGSKASHFFRPHVKRDESKEEEGGNLLWVHQEEWQKELMCKYGNCISLIDATYKTTRYDLPLFFVCVKTNVGYCTVAEFITQSECANSIGEAISILKQWNPTWDPPVVLCDYSEAEMSAIKSAFNSARIYLCDFHREQAWTRWVSNSQHGLSKSDADILLSLLRKCAWASSSESGKNDLNYMKEVEALKASHIWKQNNNVRSWLSSTWLSVPEVSQGLPIVLCIRGFTITDTNILNH